MKILLLFILLFTQNLFSESPQKQKQKLDAIANFEGIVIDSITKKPIPDAEIELKNSNLGVGYYKSKTDKTGNFLVKDFITEIDYKLSIRANGYVDYESSGAINISKKIKFILVKEGILHGKVKTSKGSGISDVDISLRPTDSYGYSHPTNKIISIKTNSEGSYSINKLPTGSYLATFEKAGHITETARIKKITPGQKLNLPMILFKSSSISGTLQIQDMNLPAGSIHAVLTAEKATHSALSFQNGEYRIEDIKPGKYKLNFSHRGFKKFDAGEITIEEGSNLDLKTTSMKLKEPEITVSTNRYTFSPADKIEFDLRTLRIEKVKVRIYRLPEKLEADYLFLRDIKKINPKENGFTSVVEWEESIRNFQPFDWNYQRLEMKDKLPTATYMIELVGEDERNISRKYFSVASAGLVAKRSAESVFVYLTNLITNEPIKNAKIAVYEEFIKEVKETKTTATDAESNSEEQNYNDNNYSYSGEYHPQKNDIKTSDYKIVKEAVTDENGIVQIPLKNSLNLLVMATSTDGSNIFCETGIPLSYENEKSKFFIYTERPVYRAGDEVLFKVIGKTRETRFLPLIKEKVNYEIIQPNSEFGEVIIDSGEVILDDWGTFNSKFKLDSAAMLGEYQIRVKNDLTQNTYEFYVEQYRKPEFKIELTPGQNSYVNGETVEFKVEAKYFFGAPLTNSVVQYRFYENKLSDTDTNYWWEDDYRDNNVYNTIRLEGEKNLTENGTALLKFQAGSYPYDREITLETTITDKSNTSITSRKTVTVGRGKFYIKINPSESFFYTTEKKEIEIKAIDHDGNPISTDITVQFYRYIWKPWQRVYVHEEKPVFIRKITTDSNGIFKLELKDELSIQGEFDIVATSSDSMKNLITASRVIWLYSGGNEKIESRFKNLELVLDKSEISKAGEVTALIKSKFTDNYVCLTIEGRDIYDKKVVKMTGNVLAVKLPIKEEYSPNLFITATVQRNRALYTTSKEVNFPNIDTSIQIKVTPDKEKYEPGDTVKLKIKVTNESDKPLQTDLSLGVVDESIYQIRYDHTPNMNPFFYTKISNWVTTNYSYPIFLLAGASKDGKNPEIRENFKDTAFWVPAVRTDANGEATIRFQVPDNLTEWRLTLRGHDKEGRVGEKTSSILVTRDIVGRIAKPRFFIESDKLNIIGITNNNTDKGMEDVKIKMEFDGKELNSEESHKISLPPYGSSKNYYSIKVPEGKEELPIKFTASAGSAKDGLLEKVKVYKNGLQFKESESGDLKDNSIINFKLHNKDKYLRCKADELRISLTPNPAAKIAGAINYLAEYPYGCMEQTINRFLPAVSLQELVEKQLIDDAYRDPELSAKISTGIKKLQDGQNDDGTFGWWSGTEGNEFVTGYAVTALTKLVKYKDYGVDTNTINKGRDALKLILENQMKNPYGKDPDIQAYALFALTQTGYIDRSLLDYAKDIIANPATNSYALSHLLRAFVYLENNHKLQGVPVVIKDTKDMLKTVAKKDAKGPYFDNNGKGQYGWQGSIAENTAHALLALLEAKDTSSLPPLLLSSIQKRSNGYYWNTTKETASVIFALNKFIETKGAVSSGKGKIEFSLDGKKVSTISFDKNTKLADLSVKIPIKKTIDSLSLSASAKEGGGSDTGFDATLQGTFYFKDTTRKEKSASLEKLQNGIELKRTFYSTKRVRDMNNVEFIVPEAMEKYSLKTGEEIMVKLRFRADSDYEYLLLEDFLPSGFEVVNTDAYGNAKTYMYKERRDERMNYFLRKIQKNKVYEIAYILRAELPGEFNVRPARMECMYAPSIAGYSVPDFIKVEK